MDLINNCTEEIESSFDENKDKMKASYIRRLDSFLDLINNDEKYFDGFNKPYSALAPVKTHIFLIFNIKLISEKIHNRSIMNRLNIVIINFV